MPTTSEEQAPDGAKRGGGKWTLLLTLVNTIGLLGLAAMMLLGSSPPPPSVSPDDVAEEALKESRSEAPGAGQAGPMLELGKLVVNLKEPGGERYLKTVLQMELDQETSRELVEPWLPQIKYQVHMLLAGQSVAGVQGPEHIEALRKQMIRKANAVLPERHIVGVWPGEWIVQ